LPGRLARDGRAADGRQERARGRRAARAAGRAGAAGAAAGERGSDHAPGRVPGPARLAVARPEGLQEPAMIQIGLASLLALLLLGASRVLGFWAFLVLMGGILAHFGDHLGTMVGKKRLSLFGVRPKYTAILVNFTTGALITSATL